MKPVAARLYVDTPLSAGADAMLDDAQMHYLRRVMRLGTGAPVALFNGRDGEWLGALAPAERRAWRISLTAQLRPQPDATGPVLAFSPIRRARLEMLVEKAVELGVGALQPVLMQRTAAGLSRPERLRAHAVEAAEQCGRLDVPAIAPPVALADLLADSARNGAALVWGERHGRAPGEVFSQLTGGADAILLVGPEGGFADEERRALAVCEGAMPVSLGPNVLRAETAALALLTLWHALAAQRPDASNAV